MVDLHRCWPAILAEHADLRDRLIDAYSDPGRGYHNVQHLLEVFERIESILQDESAPPGAQDVNLDAVLLAAWFHDAVYDAQGDNEERSAVLAAHELSQAGMPAELVGEVARLVRVTATHHVDREDLAGQLLCDADLGILAADEQRYRDYVAGVRREYAHVSDHDFRHGRARLLRRLLDAPNLFSTAYATEHWEARARANVEAELASLES